MSAFVVSMLWLPFGFEMGGLIEEWGLLGMYAKHGHFYLSGNEGVFPHFVMRPLTFLVPALAVKVGPQSFVGWHLLLIVAIGLKGVLGGWLVFRLFGSFFLSGAAILLFVTLPADTMHLSLRSLHINSAITFGVLAACVLIAALERRVSVLAYAQAFVAGIAAVVAIAMYEASVVMLLIIPGYFLAKLGLRKAFALALERATIWLLFIACIVAYAAYLLAVVGGGGSYQSNLVGGGGLDVLALTWPKLFSVGGLHIFLGGWLDAYRVATNEPVRNLVYAGLCAITLVSAVALSPRIFAGRVAPACVQFDSAVPVRLIGIGVLIALAGYVPYLFSVPHLHISQRTFLAATPGAALVWIGVLALVSVRARTLGIVFLGVSTFFGLVFQLHQFAHYQYLSDVQKRLLGEVVRAYGVREGTLPVVVRDHSNMLGHTWMFLPQNLEYALSYVIGRPTGPVHICRQVSGEWMERDWLGRTGRCYQTDEEWVFEDAEAVGGPGLGSGGDRARRRVVVPVEHAITLDVGMNGVSESALAGLRKDETVEDPTGLYTRHWPLRDRLWELPFAIGHCFRWDFGDVWSLEIPPHGNGWREAEWTVSGFNKRSAAWLTWPDGSFYFQLHPLPSEYVLRFSLMAAASERSISSLRLSLNGTQLPLVMAGLDGVATVGEGILKDGQNVLVFSSEVAEDYFGLAIMLDNVTISPFAADTGFNGGSSRGKGC